MGGAVSSGRDNNELIDNLMGGNYIRTRCVERVFRVLDRADYMTPEARDQAYKDLAWRNGPLHMSAPCIYSEVMEGLELRPGLSFLNVGSGTGYLSTLVGLILGSGGISHGIEIHPVVVEYAIKKMSQFLENSPTLDEFDFCEPKFYSGNGLCLAPLQSPYDRVYCGAGCPEEYQNYFKQLIKVGGILVMPLNDNLVQVRRVGETEWASRSLLNVSFATLRVPATKREAADLIKLDEQTPPRLQILSRAVIRSAMRAGLLRRHPELREPPRPPPAKKACPRRICIPIENDSDVATDDLNALHDLDNDGGAREMNALLSLVLSMGQNRVAGALRFDPLDSPVDSSSDDEPDDDAGAGAVSDDTSPSSADRSREQSGDEPSRANPRSRRGLLTFEFLDSIAAVRTRPRPAPAPAPAPGDADPSPSPPRTNSTRRDRTSPTEPPFPPPRPLSTFRNPDNPMEPPTRPLDTNNPPNPLEPPFPPPRPLSTLRDPTDTNEPSTPHPRSPGSLRNPADPIEPPSPPPRPLGTLRISKLRKSATDQGESSKRRTKEQDETRDRGDMNRSEKKADKPRSSTSRHDDDEDDDDDDEGSGVPAEVEIYLGKASEAGPSGDAHMDWEGELTDDESESKSKEDKRQKLDSGIGEETTPTSESSPGKSDCRSDESDADGSRRGDSLTDTDDVDDKHASRRRLQKRGRCLGPRSGSSTSCSDSSAPARRAKRRAAPAPPAPHAGAGARRVRLSVLMKRGVKELPLPYALKKYVNLGRCFEF